MSADQIATLASDIEHIRENQDAMRSAIERMSEAVTRLAVIEERQASASQAVERVMSVVEKIDERVRTLEVAEPMQARTSDWVQSAMVASVSAAAMFAAHRVGLF
jgi:response regulator RpfG family c-di-GMP phosphodiesterase